MLKIRRGLASTRNYQPQAFELFFSDSVIGKDRLLTIVGPYNQWTVLILSIKAPVCRVWDRTMYTHV